MQSTVGQDATPVTSANAELSQCNLCSALREQLSAFLQESRLVSDDAVAEGAEAAAADLIVTANENEVKADSLEV
eukprot:5912643-Pleurochrysis_carterae.AAC.3